VEAFDGGFTLHGTSVGTLLGAAAVHDGSSAFGFVAAVAGLVGLFLGRFGLATGVDGTSAPWFW